MRGILSIICLLTLAWPALAAGTSKAPLTTGDEATDLAAVVEVFWTLLSVIPRETEFWSAIAGAIVGGGIAYIVQIKALREGTEKPQGGP